MNDRAVRVVEWRRSYETVPVPVMVVERSFTITWGNPVFRQTFTNGKEFRAIPLTRVFGVAVTEDFMTTVCRQLNDPAAGFHWRGTFRFGLPGQRARTMKLLISPLFSRLEPDHPLAWTGIFDDVTDDNLALLDGFFRSLLEASRLKDHDTGNHIERVNRYAATLAEELYGKAHYPAVDRDFVAEIGFLAAMHDVGKIGTPDDILNKTTALTDEDWKIIKEHTINGAYILKTYPNPMAREIALRHHEKWNGNGYPYGLAGSTIPLAARIVAIADVYDALRMRRSYKEPMSHATAVGIIQKDAGTHFDPGLVDVFMGIEPAFAAIERSLSDDA